MKTISALGCVIAFKAYFARTSAREDGYFILRQCLMMNTVHVGVCSHWCLFTFVIFGIPVSLRTCKALLSGLTSTVAADANGAGSQLQI